MDEAENQVSNLEYKKAKNTQSEHQEEKGDQKNEASTRSFWDNFKHSNINIIWVVEEERKQEIRNLSEKIMTENFPNLVKKIVIQVQEAQRVPNNSTPKRPTLRHNIITMPKVKDKERIFKAAR